MDVLIEAPGPSQDPLQNRGPSFYPWFLFRKLCIAGILPAFCREITLVNPMLSRPQITEKIQIILSRICIIGGMMVPMSPSTRQHDVSWLRFWCHNFYRLGGFTINHQTGGSH